MIIWLLCFLYFRELGQQSLSIPQKPSSLLAGSKAAVMAVLTITIGVTSMGWWQASNQAPETIIETVEVEVVKPESAAVAILGNAENSFWAARIYQ
jgi:hypothetical protein